LRVKKAVCILMCLSMLLLPSCGRSDAASYQEQLELAQRCLAESRYEEAIIAFTAAIGIEPRSTEAYLGRADAYSALERYEEAIEDYTVVVDLEPAMEAPYLGLSKTYLALGDEDRALKALEAGYSATGSESIYEAIGSLKEEPAVQTEPESEETSAPALPYSPTIGSPQVETIVFNIRELYNATQNGISALAATSYDKKTIFAGGGEIPLITDASDGSVSYYYNGGNPYFVLITEAGTGRLTRLYLWEGELVRVLGPDGTTMDLMTEDPAFIAMAGYIKTAEDIYAAAYAYLTANHPEMLEANADPTAAMCAALVSSSYISLLGETYDEIVATVGPCTGVYADIEYPQEYSFSGLDPTLDFNYSFRDRFLLPDGSFRVNELSGEEVDARIDHQAVCTAVQFIRLGDIYSVPPGGFIPDEDICGTYGGGPFDGVYYYFDYGGYSFSLITGYDGVVISESEVMIYAY
jgi:tetratricopeptide (TPR) repeat protein